MRFETIWIENYVRDEFECIFYSENKPQSIWICCFRFFWSARRYPLKGRVSFFFSFSTESLTMEQGLMWDPNNTFSENVHRLSFSLLNLPFQLKYFESFWRWKWEEWREFLWYQVIERQNTGVHFLAKVYRFVCRYFFSWRAHDTNWKELTQWNEYMQNTTLEYLLAHSRIHFLCIENGFYLVRCFYCYMKSRGFLYLMTIIQKWTNLYDGDFSIGSCVSLFYHSNRSPCKCYLICESLFATSLLNRFF